MGSPQTAPIDVDVAAREHEVVGAGQRIPPLATEELTDVTRQLSGMIRSIFGVHDNSEIPDLFATMARTPGLYRCQLELGRELVLHGRLPPRERELAVLRTGWLCRAPFEWSEHVRFAKTCGVTSEDVERVTHGSSDPGWNEHDRALLAAVEQLLSNQSIADEIWQQLGHRWNDEQLMELPVLVGHYFLTALLHNSLRIQLQDGSRGLRQR